MPSLLVMLLAVLLPLPLRAQCSPAAGVPVSEVRFVPTCGHSFARIAANDGGAFGIWSSSHAGAEERRRPGGWSAGLWPAVETTADQPARTPAFLGSVWNGEAYAVAASTNSTTTITLVSPR